MKKFMTCVFEGLHVVCILSDDNRYRCIPKLSRGNRTDMTFATDQGNISRFRTQFFDTLDEAIASKFKHRKTRLAAREDILIAAGKLRRL